MWTSRCVGVIVFALLLAWGVAQAADEGRVQAASGTVVAVTEASQTVVVESKLDGRPWTVGARATDTTKFGGKAKSFQDVKAGDQVTIRFSVGETGAVLLTLTER